MPSGSPWTRELAEAQYLTGRLDEAERSYDLLLEHAATPLESSDAYLLMMNQYETTARYHDAIRAGMAALRLLGFPLPESAEDQRSALAEDLAILRAHLGEPSGGQHAGPAETGEPRGACSRSRC